MLIGMKTQDVMTEMEEKEKLVLEAVPVGFTAHIL